MSVNLPELPFEKNALEPFISEKTIEFHYRKHHQGYVNNLNKLIAGTEMDDWSLEKIIKESANLENLKGVFNNAAQVWNHSFYWNCLTSQGGNPHGMLVEKIKSDFGSVAEFKEQFVANAASQFGSGWGWLVLDGDRLKLMKTANADTPMVHGMKALLTLDVWEHAYYLDYQNRRPDYLKEVLQNCINWDFVEKQL